MIFKQILFTSSAFASLLSLVLVIELSTTLGKIILVFSIIFVVLSFIFQRLEYLSVRKDYEKRNYYWNGDRFYGGASGRQKYLGIKFKRGCDDQDKFAGGFDSTDCGNAS